MLIFPNGNNQRFDSVEAGGSFLTRALLQTLPNVYELSYQKLWSLESDYIPIVGNLEGYAQRIEEVRFEAKGEAKEYVDKTSDIPVLTSAFASDTFNVHTFAVALEHGLQELKSLEVYPEKLSKELKNANRVLMQEQHRLLVFGDNGQRNSTGLFSDTNVPVDGGTYDPLTATWQDHIDFFAEQITIIEDNNVLTTTVGKIYITAQLYRILATTYQENDSAKSAMEAIMKNYPSVTFHRVNECRADLLERFGASPIGTGEERIVFTPVNDDDQLDRLADAPDAHPPQWRDLSYRTIYYVRTSQTIIHKPESFRYYNFPSLRA